TESVFSISNCTSETQVKFASCTLIGSALTWWNSHMRAVSQEVAYAMPWRTLKQMMTANYTLHFQELTLLCGKMFPKESVEIERSNNVAQAYAAGSGEKPYGGTKPLCPKCNFYHDGPCRPKCTNCKKTGHLTRDCRSQAANPNYNNNNNNNNNRRATVAYQGVPTCFECGAQGHYKINCPRLGNKDQGNQNQTGNRNAVARAYGLGT
nr:hypothetical protein [Tanacetum cinerariifolium]